MKRTGIGAWPAAVLVVGLLVVGATAHAQDPEPADLLLHNGKVFTADALLSTYSAVAVRDGRIVGLGWDDLAARFEAERTIDLAGRLVVPGFIDTHVHVSGDAERWVDLAGLENIAELKARVTRKAEQIGSGEWITGYGWSEDELAEQRRPLRWDLDDAAPANPVILTRAGAHSSVASSLALEAAGVTPDTETPPGGIIEVDDEGRMNGILREGAQYLVSRLVPDATPEELRASFVENLRGLLALGITSIIQAGVDIEGYAEWETVYAAHAGELPRAAVQLRVPPDVPQAIDMLRRFGRTTGDGGEWLRVGRREVLRRRRLQRRRRLDPGALQGAARLLRQRAADRRGGAARDLAHRARHGLAARLPRHRGRRDRDDDRRLVADAGSIAPRRPPPLPQPLHGDAAGRDDAADGGLEHPHRAAAQLHLHHRRALRRAPRGRALPDEQPAAHADAPRRRRRARERHPALRAARGPRRPRSPAGGWAARWSEPARR